VGCRGEKGSRDLVNVLEREGLVPDPRSERGQVVSRCFVDLDLARNHTDRNALIRRIGPQSIEESDAVDERHLEVDEDRIGPLARDLIERLARGARRPDAIALQRQGLGKRQADPLVVVQDQQTDRFRHRVRLSVPTAQNLNDVDRGEGARLKPGPSRLARQLRRPS
jgi:hypothetical protein